MPKEWAASAGRLLLRVPIDVSPAPARDPDAERFVGRGACRVQPAVRFPPIRTDARAEQASVSTFARTCHGTTPRRGVWRGKTKNPSGPDRNQGRERVK